MKPRLDPLPLTAEDREIWFYLAPLSGPVDRVRRFRLAQMSDRRDADIMWSLGDALQVEGANPAVFGKYRGISMAHSLVATVLEIGPVLLRKVNIVYFA